jgi:hypothetical protein
VAPVSTVDGGDAEPRRRYRRGMNVTAFSTGPQDPEPWARAQRAAAPRRTAPRQIRLHTLRIGVLASAKVGLIAGLVVGFVAAVVVFLLISWVAGSGTMDLLTSFLTGKVADEISAAVEPLLQTGPSMGIAAVFGAVVTVLTMLGVIVAAGCYNVLAALTGGLMVGLESS